MEYYNSQKSVKEYINLAAEVSSQQLIERFLEHLNENHLVLELGSGPGTDWEILNKKVNTIGSDLSEVFLDHLRSTYPRGKFLKIDAIHPNPPQNFDGIYANKVLHHLTDKELIDSLKNQAGILKRKGIVCHSFWNGKGEETFKGMYVNYHDENDLHTFYKNDYTLIEILTYKEFEPNDSIMVIAQKK